MATCSFARLPVVCFDAMLPGQRLELTTEDPTLCDFLMQLRLGGMFCMTSLDPRERACAGTALLCASHSWTSPAAARVCR